MKIGELFSGYGGLGMGVQAALGGDIAWHSEVDPGASRILAHRYPGVPNHGDITRIDWARVEPVDVLTGGSPCQDVSSAGKRAGMRAGTRSGLWASMVDGIDALRPRLVVWENVRGALSAGADSAVEPCPGCVGDGTGTHLRALGRVLGDLADIGYDARWVGVRAADAGAPHGRWRVFVAAAPAHAGGGGSRVGRSRPDGRPVAVDGVRHGAPADAEGVRRDEGRAEPAGEFGRPDAAERGHGAPADADDLGRRRIEELDARPARGLDGEHRGHAHRRCDGTHRGEGAGTPWGAYGPAVARWEAVLGRPAPRPTHAGARGGERLDPAFVEWMMGLPAGWVTDVPGLGRNAQLKALGNGVVPQAAALALARMGYGAARREAAA